MGELPTAVFNSDFSCQSEKCPLVLVLNSFVSLFYLDGFFLSSSEPLQPFSTLPMFIQFWFLH